MKKSIKGYSATKWWLLKMYHLRHKLRIFLFHRKVMFCFQDIQVFVFLTILCFTKSDVMMNTWDRVHFWIYLLNHNSVTHQTWSVDRYKEEQHFPEIFRMIWRIVPTFQALFNLATSSNYSTTDCDKFPVFYLLKGWIRENWNW